MKGSLNHFAWLMSVVLLIGSGSANSETQLWEFVENVTAWTKDSPQLIEDQLRGLGEIAPGLQVTSVDVRRIPAGKLQSVLVDLKGKCILPQEVSGRYTDAAHVKRASSTTVDERILLNDARVSFRFRSTGQCLSRVVIQPLEVPWSPKWPHRANSGDQSALWRLVETMLTAVKSNGQAVIDAWPSNVSLDGSRQDTHWKTIDGGSFVVGQHLKVSMSEVRIRNSDGRSTVSLELEGACIAPADVVRAFPDADFSAYPQPESPDPTHYFVADRGEAKALFQFGERGPECLRAIFMSPAEFPSAPSP